MNNGFVYVATYESIYYSSAVLSAESLKDYYPEANITLFTDKKFVNNRSSIFDNVVTENVPDKTRSKMWGMARTPYEKTFYIDADTEVMHEDIKNVFDNLDENHDMAMTKVRSYSAVITKFPGGEFTWHCGVCLYNNKPVTLQFMQDWYDYYNRQEKMKLTGDWDLPDSLYPREELWHWDTFTFWRLLHLEGYDKKLKIQSMKDDARWNSHNYRQSDRQKPVIIEHHTLNRKKRMAQESIND